MKLLIIEDQDEKLSIIHEFVTQVSKGIEVDIAKSFYEGKRRLFNERYDLVLLDMSLPVYTPIDGEPSSMLVYGGEDLLSWAQHRVTDLKVVVITQFDTFSTDGKQRTLEDLRKNLMEEFHDMVVDVVLYLETENSWQERLKLSIKNVQEGKT